MGHTYDLLTPQKYLLVKVCISLYFEIDYQAELKKTNSARTQSPIKRAHEVYLELSFTQNNLGEFWQTYLVF